MDVECKADNKLQPMNGMDWCNAECAPAIERQIMNSEYRIRFLVAGQNCGKRFAHNNFEVVPLEMVPGFFIKETEKRAKLVGMSSISWTFVLFCSSEDKHWETHWISAANHSISISDRRLRVLVGRGPAVERVSQITISCLILTSHEQLNDTIAFDYGDNQVAKEAVRSDWNVTKVNDTLGPVRAIIEGEDDRDDSERLICFTSSEIL